MSALFRYTLSTMLHSQRYLPPVVLFVAALAVGTTNGSGRLAPAYALASGALFLCSTWLTVVLINIEDPVHRAITTVHAGRSRNVLLAAISVAWRAVGSSLWSAWCFP